MASERACAAGAVKESEREAARESSSNRKASNSALERTSACEEEETRPHDWRNGCAIVRACGGCDKRVGQKLLVQSSRAVYVSE